MQLPIKIEGIMYAIKDGAFSFLIIKRSPEDGGFWQPLTETMEEGETILGSLRRGLAEEVGVADAKSFTDQIYRFEFKNKSDHSITEFVYGVELAPEQKITLSHEHTDFAWLSYEDAVAKLEKENNRKSFAAFKAAVMDKVAV